MTFQVFCSCDFELVILIKWLNVRPQYLTHLSPDDDNKTMYNSLKTEVVRLPCERDLNI